MNDDDTVRPPERQTETDSDREWVCPNCGHRKRRHHSATIRPFCGPCEWRHAMLVQMVPQTNGAKVDLP
jgi:ribosomal protein L37AE/L43A